MVSDIKPSKRHLKNLERARKSRENADYLTQTPFRLMERKFKSRVPPPDYSECIDFSSDAIDQHPKLNKIAVTDDMQNLLGADNCSQITHVYTIPEIPGMPKRVVIVCPLFTIKQDSSLFQTL
jgi:alkylated DNA repair protein alkB family protein 1